MTPLPSPPPPLLPLPLFPGPGVNLLVSQGSVAWGGGRGEWGVWEGKEGWTGMVRNPSPCSSSIDTGIIPSPEPSPHWLASRLGFSLRLGPWHHGYYFSWCGCLFSGRLACSWNGLSWLFGTLARRCKWAEYISKARFCSSFSFAYFLIQSHVVSLFTNKMYLTFCGFPEATV